MEIHSSRHLSPGVTGGDARGGSGSRSLSAAPYTSTSHYGHRYAVPLFSGIPGAAIRRQRIMGRSQISVRFGDGRSVLKCTPPRGTKSNTTNSGGDPAFVNPRHRAYYTGVAMCPDDLSPLESARRHRSPSPAPRGRPGAVSPGPHRSVIPHPMPTPGAGGGSAKVPFQKGFRSIDPSSVSAFRSRGTSPASFDEDEFPRGGHLQLRKAGVRCLALHSRSREASRGAGRHEGSAGNDTRFLQSLSSSHEQLQRQPSQGLTSKQKMNTLREEDIKRSISLKGDVRRVGDVNVESRRVPATEKADDVRRFAKQRRQPSEAVSPGILKTAPSRSRSLARGTESRAERPSASRGASSASGQQRNPARQATSGGMARYLDADRKTEKSGASKHLGTKRGELSDCGGRAGQLQRTKSTIRYQLPEDNRKQDGELRSVAERSVERDQNIHPGEQGHYSRKPTTSTVLGKLQTMKSVRLYSSFFCRPEGAGDESKSDDAGDELLEEGGPPEGYDSRQLFSPTVQETPSSPPLRSALTTTRAPTTSDEILLSPTRGFCFGDDDDNEEDELFSDDEELLANMADPYSPLPDTPLDSRKKRPAFASRDAFRHYVGFTPSRTSSESSVPPLRPGISWEVESADEVAPMPGKKSQQTGTGRKPKSPISASASDESPSSAMDGQKNENEVEALASRLLHVAKAVTDQVEMSIAMRTASQARPPASQGGGRAFSRPFRSRTPGGEPKTEGEFDVDEEAEEAVARFGWFVLNELKEVRHTDSDLTRAYVHLGKVLEDLRKLQSAPRSQRAPKRDKEREEFLDGLEVSLRRRYDHEDPARTFAPPFPSSDLTYMRSPLSCSAPTSRNPRLFFHPPSDGNEQPRASPSRSARLFSRETSPSRGVFSHRSDRSPEPRYRPSARGSHSDRLLTERRKKQEKSALFRNTVGVRRTGEPAASKEAKAVEEQAEKRGGTGGKQDMKGGHASSGRTTARSAEDAGDDVVVLGYDTEKRCMEISPVMWGVDRSTEKSLAVWSKGTPPGLLTGRSSKVSPVEEYAEDTGEQGSRTEKKKQAGGDEALHITINSRVQENLANDRVLHFMGPPVLATEEDTRQAEAARKHQRELEALQDALEQTALLEACVQSTGKPTTMPLSSVTQHLPANLSGSIHAVLRGSGALASKKEGLGLEELRKVKQVLQKFEKMLLGGGEEKEGRDGREGRGNFGKGAQASTLAGGRKHAKDGDSARSTSSLMSTVGVLEDKAPQSPLSRPGSRLRFVDPSFRRERDERRPGDGEFHFSPASNVVGESTSDSSSAQIPQLVVPEPTRLVQSPAIRAAPSVSATSSQLVQRSMRVDAPVAEADGRRSVTTSAVSASIRTSDSSKKEVTSSLRSPASSSSAASTRRNLLAVSSASRVAGDSRSLKLHPDDTGTPSSRSIGRSGFVESDQAFSRTQGQFQSSRLPVVPPSSSVTAVAASTALGAPAIPTPQISVRVPEEQQGEIQQEIPSPDTRALPTSAAVSPHSLSASNLVGPPPSFYSPFSSRLVEPPPSSHSPFSSRLVERPPPPLQSPSSSRAFDPPPPSLLSPVSSGAGNPPPPGLATPFPSAQAGTPSSLLRVPFSSMPLDRSPSVQTPFASMPPSALTPKGDRIQEGSPPPHVVTGVLPTNQSIAPLPFPPDATPQQQVQGDTPALSVKVGEESREGGVSGGSQLTPEEAGNDGKPDLIKTASGKLKAECSAARLSGVVATGPEPPAGMKTVTGFSSKFPSFVLPPDDTEEHYELVVSLGQLKNIFVFEEDRVPKKVFCVAHYQGQDVQQLVRRKVQRSKTKQIKEEDAHSYGCSFDEELVLPYEPKSVGVRITVMQLTLEDDILQSLPALEDFQYVPLGTTPLLLYSVPTQDKSAEAEKKFWSLLNTEDPGASTGEISVALFPREREPGAPPLRTPTVDLLFADFKREPSRSAGRDSAKRSSLLVRGSSQKPTRSQPLLDGPEDKDLLSNKSGDETGEVSGGVTTGGEDAEGESKVHVKKDKKKKKKHKHERKGDPTKGGEEKEKKEKEGSREEETKEDQPDKDTTEDHPDKKDTARDDTFDAGTKVQEAKGEQMQTEEDDFLSALEGKTDESPAKEASEGQPDRGTEVQEPQTVEQEQHTRTPEGKPAEEAAVDGI